MILHICVIFIALNSYHVMNWQPSFFLFEICCSSFLVGSVCTLQTFRLKNREVSQVSNAAISQEKVVTGSKSHESHEISIITFIQTITSLFLFVIQSLYFVCLRDEIMTLPVLDLVHKLPRN